MTKTIYTTREAAQIEADKLNASRKRDNFEYVVGEHHDFSTGKMIAAGWYVGVCSND